MRDRYYLSWSSESNPMACFFLVPLTRRVVNASSRLKILRFETASPLFRGLSSVTRASLLLLLLLLSRRAFSSFLFFFLLSSFLFLSSTYPRRNQWDSIEISLSKRSTDLFPIIGNLLVRTWNVVGSFEFVRRVFFFPLTVIDSSTVKWSAPFRRKRTSRSKKNP